MSGISLVILLAIVSILAPTLAPYDPLKVDMTYALKPPDGQHLMGTDQLGRDIFSRVLYGGRLSLPVGLIAVLVGVIGGGILGLSAGYYGGWIDTVVMRLVDIMLVFPSILLALLIMSITGPGLSNVMIAVGISGIPRYARLYRGCILSVKENTYVEAARTIGARGTRIMVRHLLPNVIAPVIVYATLGVSTAILWAAALSFLGLGAQPPRVEWGSMINYGRNYISLAWWLTFFPGMAITLAILGLNMAGDGLREALDPRLKRV
jgi:ABC-type dipeptide/oligopeptide/nickel transport system permease subunit